MAACVKAAQDVQRKYLTPPQYARQLGVEPPKIIAWIRAGELRAINIAESRKGRPRWRISLDAIAEFESTRASRPPVKPVHRRRSRDTAPRTYF